jgi:hypothetical protein
LSRTSAAPGPCFCTNSTASRSVRAALGPLTPQQLELLGQIVRLLGQVDFLLGDRFMLRESERREPFEGFGIEHALR